MYKLELDNFKAFSSSMKLTFTNNGNMLIYGENGSGKTSIFEAIKLFFFRDRLFNEQIPPNVVGVEREIFKQRIIDSYKKDITRDLLIKVDDYDNKDYDYSHNVVFLISYDNINLLDEICIEDIINGIYITGIDRTTTWLSNELLELFVNNINNVLKEFFWCDDVKVETIDQRGLCSLKNVDNPLPKASNLSSYFNEAILHVVRLIIMIEGVSYYNDKGKQTILVLDDCFNSLDIPNRTFMMKYLLNRTKGIQKIVLTHNTGFFNLFHYIFNNCVLDKEEWLEIQLCKINNQHRFIDGSEETTKEIRDKLSQMSPADVGNCLRQRFEVLIFQLTRLNNIGELQEASVLLDKLCSINSHIYLSVEQGQIKDIYGLVNEIYANVTNGNYYNLAHRLRQKIESYRQHDFLKSIQPTLKDLRLLQKVALHQSSHGHEGLPPISSTEIEIALSLLEKLEAAVKAVTIRTDVSSV